MDASLDPTYYIPFHSRTSRMIPRIRTIPALTFSLEQRERRQATDLLSLRTSAREHRAVSTCVVVGKPQVQAHPVMDRTSTRIDSVGFYLRKVCEETFRRQIWISLTLPLPVASGGHIHVLGNKRTFMVVLRKHRTYLTVAISLKVDCQS